MASGRYRGIPQQDLDIRQIIQEAQIRWLRPLEVCEILRNYQKYNFKLNPVPPNKPTSGALFLFDRKALRYFRKDGHNWRKKKDGKTVREAHERLKAGSIDVLHCYYAHGEENPSFQRRSYWMLEGAYEHIVLVHYLEVSQSHRPGVYYRPIEQLAEGTTTPSYFSPPISEHNGASMSPENFDATGSSLSGELDDADSSDDVEEIQPPVQMPKSEPSLLQQLSLPRDWSSLLSSPNLVQDPVANVASTSSGSFSQQQHPSFQQNQRLSPAQPAQGRGLMDDDIDLDDLLKNPGKYLGQKPLTPAVSLDVNGWKEILHNYQSSDTNGSIQGGMKQEIPSWQEMLEQCTTPATRNSLLGSVAPIKFDDDLFQSPVGNKSNMMPQTTTSPKGIVEALSPRGLGREPQTVLEAHLRAATEQNALKSAHSYSLGNRRWQETDSFPLQNDLDVERASQQMETSQSWSFASTQQIQNGALPVSNSNNHWNDVQQQLPQWQQQQDYMASSPAVKDGKFVKQSDAGDGLKKMDSFGLKKMDSFGLKKMDSFGLKKMDSFGRWVIQQMGEDSPGALAAPSDSGSYWMTPLEDENTPEETSGFSAQMQLDVSISISQVQRYSITDFSPDCAVSNEQAKVLVSGRFLETVSNPLDYKWCCMFGDVEVPAELINHGVLRCKVPPHSPGRIPFYITCSDRLACSEVREFEIRAKQEGPLASKADESNAQSDKDILVQVRLARMLLSDAAADKETSSIQICEASIEEWNLIEVAIEKRDVGQLVLKEKLLELFFKHKLPRWLSCREDGTGKGASVLDEHGQGVFHMVSALGYDWAIKPILEAGVVPDFRDVRGWTALHWAASFGREKTVLALLAAGASPGPVTDPTPKYPNGQMPSDLAAASGHKGIAGYLAEKTLTNHLSSLTIAEKNLNEISSTSATLAGETAVQDYIGKRLEGQDEHLSLQRSLSAVRNATKVASLIHSAFRQDSFRKRSMMPEEEPDEYGMLSTEIRSMLATQKIQKAYRGHHDDKVQSAALQIQRKYKGWKGRKDFLNLRKHVLRIQAHVRGHQVRKHFRKILWVVGVIEKAVLRWRRKRVGLRGFRLELAEDKLNGLSSDDEDFLREGRKQKELVLEKAVTRVQSMARSEDARAQYRRMLEGSQKAEHEYQQPGRNAYEEEDDIMTSAD